MPAGRPTKYRPEMCEIAEAVLSEGFSHEVLAGELDVDPDTITAWKAEHEEFLGAVKRGLAKGRKFWEEIGINGTTGKIDGYNATSWIFNMKNRFRNEWADRQEHTGEGGGPIKTESKVLQVVGVSKNADPDT